MNNAYLQRRICLVSRVVEDFLKNFEEGSLEHHGRHFAVPGDAVEHFGDAMIGERRIGCILTQHKAVSVDDFTMSEPADKQNLLSI